MLLPAGNGGAKVAEGGETKEENRKKNTAGSKKRINFSYFLLPVFFLFLV